MKWSEFVDGCYEWSDEKIIKNIERIETFGTGEEVESIIGMIPDGKPCERLIVRAIEAGVRFPLPVISELELAISPELIYQLMDMELSRKNIYTEAEINELKEELCEDCLSYVIKKSLENGGTYSKKCIMDIKEYVNEDALDAMVEKSLGEGVEYSESDMIDIYYGISKRMQNKLLNLLIERKKVLTFDEINILLEDYDFELIDNLIMISLKNGGSYKKAEILELAESVDEKTVAALIKTAINSGVKYSRADIKKYEDYFIDEEAYKELVEFAKKNKENTDDDTDADNSSVEPDNYSDESSSYTGKVYTIDQIKEKIGFLDTDTMDTIVMNALEHGEVFELADIQELGIYLSEEMRDHLINLMVQRKKKLSYDELEYINEQSDGDYLSDAIINSVRNGAHYSYEKLDEIGVVGNIDEDVLGEVLLKSVEAGESIRNKDIVELTSNLDEDILFRLAMYSVKREAGMPYDVLIELADYVSEAAFSELVMESVKRGRKYTVDQILHFGDYIDEDVLLMVICLSGIHLTRKDFDQFERYVDIEKLMNLAFEMGSDAYAPDPYEIIDSIELADTALEHLYSAVDLLSDAKGWHGFSMLSKRPFFDALKYADLSEASMEINAAVNALKSFRYELNFMRGVLRFKVTDFISFVDVFTNSIVADVLVNRKINNAKDKCKDAIRSVNSIRSDLVDLLKKYQENHED